MQVDGALRKLRQLSEASRDGDPRHRMTPHIFQQPACEVTHVQHGTVRQPIKSLRCRFGGRSGRGDAMVKPVGAGDIDTEMNRGNPGCA